jgi:membrane-bound metal-dependent hydrolase YbcI (DUF457 family)
MFVGHLAAGLIGKRVEPRISLGTWMLAVMLADLLAFLFLIAGIEHFRTQPGVLTNRMAGDIPYSHSLLMDLLWAALLAAAFFLWRRYSRGAWFLFAAVLSHWILDVVSHRPDMQLAPGVPTALGLGLWNSIPATLIVEGGVWLFAIIFYVSATHAKKWTGIVPFWIGIVLLSLAWYSNIRAGMDPNQVRAGISSLIFFSLVVAWAFWMNRTRSMKAQCR